MTVSGETSTPSGVAARRLIGVLGGGADEIRVGAVQAVLIEAGSTP